MILLSSMKRAVLRVEPIDFRKGIDGLIGHIHQNMSEDARSGAAFIFRNRMGTGIKVLFYDGCAYWLCQRRLSTGKLRHWPRHEHANRQLDIREFLIVLFDGDLEGVRFQPIFDPGLV